MNSGNIHGIIVVRSGLLAHYPDIVSGISTRRGGMSREPFGMNLSYSVGDTRADVVTNRLRFFDTLGISEGRVAFPSQIHSNTVKTANAPGSYADCDALISKDRDVYLSVSIADCTPVFLHDPVTGSVAAVHSGWRGSKSKLLSKVVEKLIEDFAVIPRDIVAYIGPSAGVCCYEVGEDVASAFDGAFVRREAGKRPHLDVKRFNRHLLIASGAREENIEVSEDCTICHPEMYHSFRRDGNRSGRMLGVIGMKEMLPPGEV